MLFRLILIILSFSLNLIASVCPLVEDDIPECELLGDLTVVNAVDCWITRRMPVTYNHLLQGGYFSMPSARMGHEGVMAVGYTYVNPYRIYNLRAQITDRLEITGNYRVFKGVEDPILSPSGFGDFSDKGVNFKFAVVHPEDSDYTLPGIAFGMEDFLGTCAFRAHYLVATQVFPNINLEASLGYGWKRIQRWFGGLTWIPFHNQCTPYLKGFALVAEYDAIPYKSKTREPHPDGRTQKSHVNVGIKWRLYDSIDVGLSWIRGQTLALTTSAFYNLGYTKGFLPKINDPLPYKGPIISETICGVRGEDAMGHEFVSALQNQGFLVLNAYLSRCNSATVLRLNVQNKVWWTEQNVRLQLNNSVSRLTAEELTDVIVTIEGDSCPIQEYHYPVKFLKKYREMKMGDFELEVLSPKTEVSYPPRCGTTTLFARQRCWFNPYIAPKFRTFFGSATGKFKYSTGIQVGGDGYLFNDIYYSAILGYTVISNLYSLKGVDKLNPSQIINVRSDIVRYYNQKNITFDELFIQKCWNLSRGWYARLAAGLFETQYGGAAGELLYAPVNSSWAIGFEAAALRKRTLDGVGFSDKVRKLHGEVVTYQKFHGSQYFIDLYYDLKAADIEFKVQGGKFLANDWGVRYEVSRYYPSGLTIGLWYTRTDGGDTVNGATYYDKGVAFTMPLDIFCTYSSRDRWGYGMSAWLRDVGARGYTGRELYEMVKRERPHY